MSDRTVTKQIASAEDLDREAKGLDFFLDSNPCTSDLQAMAVRFDVPPSQRSSRARCIESLRRVVQNNRTNATIARLASGPSRRTGAS